MVIKKKTSPPKKGRAGAKSAGERKPSARGRAGASAKKTADKPAFLVEIRKICICIAILVGICLTVAMVADLYFHPGRAKSPVALVKDSSVKKNPSVHGKKKSGVKKFPDRSVEQSDHLSEGKQKEDSLKDEKTTPVPQKRKEKASIEKVAKKEKTKVQKHQKTKVKTPVYEVFHEADPDPSPVVAKPSRKPGSLPKIVVIIDDIGFDKKTAMGLCAVDRRITFSVLPWSPFGKTLANRLAAKGAQIMLHLPMEPMGYPKVDPGPGALLVSMEPDKLLAQLRKDLAAIPHIVGVNNHMGSRLTTSENQMNQVFTILKKEKLFFVDSRTSINSKCASAARLLQIPFAQRDVFLDNVQNVSYISKQFGVLVKMAKKHGSAIGIGHPYKETLEALAKELPKVSGKVELVPANALVHVLN